MLQLKNMVRELKNFYTEKHSKEHARRVEQTIRCIFMLLRICLHKSQDSITYNA